MAKNGELFLLLSSVLYSELKDAPNEVLAVLEDLPAPCYEQVGSNDEAGALRDQYLAAGVVGEAHFQDALHVAVATVYDSDMVISWNFKHLVHIEKIRGFNAVNIRNGYRTIDIRTPSEVIPQVEGGQKENE
ncbi:MAG: PIN domain protein [Candidatus Hydrogenedentes bacterium]|nr:PIN domain protein [Candidatus Hydrogenedentota bacterium]